MMEFDGENAADRVARAAFEAQHDRETWHRELDRTRQELAVAQGGVAALRAENERLRAALAPFADYATLADERPRPLSNAAPLDYRPGSPTGLTLGDCRRARAVLKGEPDGV